MGTLYTLRTGASAHPEDSVLQQITDLISASGVTLLASHFLVAQQASPDMTVKVAVGRAFIKGLGNAYPVRMDDSVSNVPISSNGSGNSRKDAVVLYIDISAGANTDASNVAKLIAVAGTPGASPVAPSDADILTALGATTPFLRLANVTVASGATTILTANILDMRVQVQLNSNFIPTAVEPYTVNTITSSATPTPIIATKRNFFAVTALAAGATVAAPSGTPTDGMGLIMRFKDNGTARALAFNAIYRIIGVILPITTTINKTLYIGAIYNLADSKWDVLAIQQEL